MREEEAYTATHVREELKRLTSLECTKEVLTACNEAPRGHQHHREWEEKRYHNSMHLLYGRSCAWWFISLWSPLIFTKLQRKLENAGLKRLCILLNSATYYLYITKLLTKLHHLRHTSLGTIKKITKPESWRWLEVLPWTLIIVLPLWVWKPLVHCQKSPLYP